MNFPSHFIAGKFALPIACDNGVWWYLSMKFSYLEAEPYKVNVEFRDLNREESHVQVGVNQVVVLLKAMVFLIYR